MRLRHKKGSEELIATSDYCIHNSNDILTYFKNNKPLYLELGMGKGQFICKNAKNYQNINYIGIEKYATVILRAIENYKNVFEKDNVNPTNLKFLCEDIINIKEYFKEKSVDKIYLNFSDPWPKKRHENRRITHKKFLKIYNYLLKDNGTIELKTDNVELFEFSINQIKDSDEFNIINFTYDLHNDKNLNQNNILTEYEEKFSKLGNKICKLIAIKKDH